MQIQLVHEQVHGSSQLEDARPMLLSQSGLAYCKMV